MDFIHDLVGYLAIVSFTMHRTADVVDHDTSPALRHVQGVQPSQTPTGACHNHGLTFEVDHGLFLLELRTDWHISNVYPGLGPGVLPTVPMPADRLKQKLGLVIIRIRVKPT
jgi:hypothetical protein